MEYELPALSDTNTGRRNWKRACVKEEELDFGESQVDGFRSSGLGLEERFAEWALCGAAMTGASFGLLWSDYKEYVIVRSGAKAV